MYSLVISEPRDRGQTLATSKNSRSIANYDYERLCETCQSIFDSDVIQLLVERPKDTYYTREHLLCGELPLSARTCHLCRWMLAECMRVRLVTEWIRPQGEDPGTESVTSQSIEREEALCGQYEEERIRLKIGRIVSGTMGLELSTLSESEMSFAGTVLLAEIVPANTYESPSQEKSLHARRQTPRACLNSTTISTLRTWLYDCLNRHKSCSIARQLLSDPAVTPARLLEIADNGRRVRVRNSKELSVPVQYLTLSHCWGQSVRCKLLANNIHKYQTRIPTRDLTRSFKEAIQLTSELGFSYLWIDALCIQQDSAEDWRKESSKMGNIYAGGVLNIAATAARNGDCGLFHTPPVLTPCMIRFQDAEMRHFLFLTHDESDYHRRIVDAPLAHRAWVFQERLLSPCTVHCTTDQLLWECICCHAAEYLPERIFPDQRDSRVVSKSMLLDKYKSSKSNSSMYETWASLIQLYSSCKLSVKTDKLPAISGLASRLAKQWGIESGSYLAGLWRENLTTDLLWQTILWEGVTFPERAPSWSWARVDGPVNFGEISGPRCISVISVSTSPVNDSYGMTPTGSVTLQGPLCRARQTSYKREPGFRELMNELDLLLDSSTILLPGWGIQWDDWSSETTLVATPMFVLVCVVDNLLLGRPTARGLVLRSTGKKRGEYERIGMVQIHTTSAKLLAISSNQDLLSKVDYLGYDAEKGFIVTIV